MSKQGVVPSRETVEALRDFAFAYYSEHEGPSESEHKALNLAQALDGDLARAAQAAPDPIWNCMCGHCESWSDHGGGMGWCSEHNTMTVSGHSCKRARPKAEYAEPAGETEAPIPEPPAADATPPPETPFDPSKALRVLGPRRPWKAVPGYVEPPPSFGTLPPAPEAECPLEDLVPRYISVGPGFRHPCIDVVRLDSYSTLWQGNKEAYADNEAAREALEALRDGIRALAADRAKLEGECAERAVERLGLVKQIKGLRERAEHAEANIKERNRCAERMEGLLREAQAECDRLRDDLATANERAEQAEARAQAAEKRAEGCYPLPSGMTRNEWRDQLALWGRVCRLEPLDKSIELIKGLLAGLTIERGTEVAEAIADEVERLTEQRPEVVHL